MTYTKSYLGYKECIIGILKFKMAEIRHLENVKSPYLKENHQILMTFGT